MKDIPWATEWIIDWIGRMAARYGGIVYDGNKKLDWGQALCREMYGPHWATDSRFKVKNDANGLDNEDVRCAKVWEAGTWPEWARRGRSKKVNAANIIIGLHDHPDDMRPGRTP